MDAVTNAPGRSTLPLRHSLATAGVVVGATVVVLGLVLLVLGRVEILRQQPLAVLAWLVPVHGVLVLAGFHLVLRRAGRTWGDLGFVRPGRRLLHVLWQVPAALVLLVVAQGVVVAVAGQERLPQESALDELLLEAGPVTRVALVVGAAVLVPLWEEAFFRGVVHRGLARRFGVAVGVAVSAVLFAAAHGVPVLVPYFLVAGVLLALMAQFHRSLWGPFVLHATVNGLVVLVVLTLGP